MGGVEVSPRDVVAACLPDPAGLGDRMRGKTCAGTWVTGTGTDGNPREVYLFHVVDNEWSMAEYGSQAVVWQTAINPVVAMELLATGAWSGAGRARPRGAARPTRSSTSDRLRLPVGPARNLKAPPLHVPARASNPSGPRFAAHRAEGGEGDDAPRMRTG